MNPNETPEHKNNQINVRLPGGATMGARGSQLVAVVVTIAIGASITYTIWTGLERVRESQQATRSEIVSLTEHNVRMIRELQVAVERITGQHWEIIQASRQQACTLA